MAHLIRTLGALAAFASLSFAQTPAPGTTKDDEDVVKEGPIDPFTKGDAKAMQALGILSYGPMDWADGKRTGDIEKILGENRILWVETAHFRIGCNLGTTAAPAEPDVRKLTNTELQRLNKKWSKVPGRASKLSPWLRLHLFAQRAEDLYADFAKLVGHDDASGTHLGQKGKFALLLFQKKSDLVRYLDTFCGRKSELSQGVSYGSSGQIGFVLTAEDDDPRTEADVHAHFRFLLVQTFVDAQGGAPYWAKNGIAHWYERQIETNMIFCAIRDDEHVDPMQQGEWHKKVFARAKRDDLFTPFRDLCTVTDLGYYGHIQSWSRVDFLLAQDRAKFGQLMLGMKGGYTVERHEQLLTQLYGMDFDQFDAKWRAWVAKTYK
ncbi:MAG: hypothetical protein JNL08_04390 [Planctomycetes bacterium]|nr:hypothetical protein [Planctomycetota bacterium]